MAQKNHYVGSEAQLKRGLLSLAHPVEHGIVVNWKNMEAVWQHAFYNELQVSPEEHNILLAEPPQNPRKNREVAAEILFETFNVKSMYVALQGVLALYASGFTTGLVLNVGDGVTYATPFFEGYAMQPAIHRMELGGREVTEYLMRQLNARGFPFSTSSDFELVRELKERLSSTAYPSLDDVRRESALDIEEAYSLPDGKRFNVGIERFRCVEVLFNPSLLGLEEEGVHVLTYNSIKECNIDFRKQLFANILLAGGVTLTPRFGARLKKSLEGLAPATLTDTLNIIAPDNRLYSVWIGGSILSSLSTFQQMWIKRAQYDELGSNVMNIRCF